MGHNGSTPGPGQWLLRNADVVIALAVLLAYWPLTTFGWAISPGDTLDCWLPWRHFITQSLSEGKFPIWNPYQQGGYPVYADLQGPAWYVEALMIGGTIGHSIYTLQTLFLIYLIIGGCGMRRFALEVTGSRTGALVAGLAYSLSGFLTAHTQHFYSIISAAWIPWLLWSQVKLIHAPRVREAVRSSVFTALLLTGGNHTFMIMGVYLLAALLMQGVAVLGAGLMACGTLWSAMEVWPYITRAQGLDPAAAGLNPFHWKAWISLVSPYAGSAALNDPPMNPAMANGFFGVLPLAGLLAALRSGWTPMQRLLVGFALVSALASLGDVLFVHRLLYDFVPGMSLFRFPNYFWLFVLIGVLPMACAALAEALGDEPSRKRLLRSAIALQLVVLCIFAYAAVSRSGSDWSLFADHATLLRRMTAPDPMERLVWSASVSMLVLLLLAMVLWKRRLRVSGLIALCSLEMMMAVQWQQWSTSLFDHPAATIQERIAMQPRAPVIPELVAMDDGTDGARELHLLWRNLHDFLARPSHLGFNSFWLAAHDSLLFASPVERARAMSEPWAYFSGQAQCSAIEPLTYDHNGFTLRTRCAQSGRLVIQQSAFPGWSAEVDGRPVAIQPAQVSCFGLNVPAGDHVVEVRFLKAWVGPMVWIAMLSFFGALLYLTLTSSQARRTLAVGSVVLLAGALAWPFAVNVPNREAIDQALPRLREIAVKALGEGSSVVVNTDREAVLRPMLPPIGITYVRCTGLNAQDRLQAALPATLPQHLLWIDVGIRPTCEVRSYLEDRYRIGAVQQLGGGIRVRRLDRGPRRDQRLLYRQEYPNGLALGQGNVKWSPAYRALISDLLPKKGDLLVISATCSLSALSVPQLVLEYKSGEEVIDHEAYPIRSPGAGAGALRTLTMVRSLDHYRGIDLELGAYVLSDHPDTIVLHSMEIRIVSNDPWIGER